MRSSIVKRELNRGNHENARSVDSPSFSGQITSHPEVGLYGVKLTYNEHPVLLKNSAQVAATRMERRLFSQVGSNG